MDHVIKVNTRVFIHKWEENSTAGDVTGTKSESILPDIDPGALFSRCWPTAQHHAEVVQSLVFSQQWLPVHPSRNSEPYCSVFPPSGSGAPFPHKWNVAGFPHYWTLLHPFPMSIIILIISWRSPQLALGHLSPIGYLVAWRPPHHIHASLLQITYPFHKLYCLQSLPPTNRGYQTKPVIIEHNRSCNSEQ